MGLANTTAAVGVRAWAGIGDDGEPTYTTTWTVYDEAIWWPSGSREGLAGQDQVTWEDTLCLPTGTVVDAAAVVIPVVTLDESGAVVHLQDGVTPAGDQYEVNGQPAAWPAGGSGWQPPFSVVVHLQRQAG